MQKTNLMGISKVNSVRGLLVDHDGAKKNADRDDRPSDNVLRQFMSREPLWCENTAVSCNERPGGQQDEETQRDQERMEDYDFLHLLVRKICSLLDTARFWLRHCGFALRYVFLCQIKREVPGMDVSR